MPAITKIYEENTFTVANQTWAGPGTVTVEEDAFVSVVGADAFDLSDGPWKVTIDGTIQSNLNGIVFNGAATKNSTLKIGTEGAIINSAGFHGAIETHHGLDVTNSGVVRGYYGIEEFGSAKTVTITNSASGEIYGSAIGIVDGGTIGMLVIKNAGVISGNVGYGIVASSHLTLTNSGTISDMSTSLAASITNSGTIGVTECGDGDDKVTNTGELANINFKNGENSLTNGGYIPGNVLFGIGDDTMTNTGTIEGNVTLSDGMNKVTNSGTLLASLSAGNGDDTFKITGSVIGEINPGGGNDQVTGGNNVEFVRDGGGDDVYKLGGGNDVVIYTTFGNDSFDGGTGSDTFDSSSFNDFSLAYNLGTKAFSTGFGTYAASSLSTVSETPVGTIKGFETVLGTKSSDVFIGGGAAETFDGASGVDRIIGGGGADRLTGGTGDDIFAYFDVKDSGKTVATRDTITDFTGANAVGGDSIDFSAIDTNTKLAGDQGFSWIGNDKEFNHVAGVAELRSVTINGDTILQGDVNGDGKVDFSIDVVGTQNFIATDFVL